MIREVLKMAAIQKGDIIKLYYAGYVAETNELFDTNIEEVAKQHNKYNKDVKYEPITVIVGERHVIPGLDDALIGKEIGKEYVITIDAKDGFGERDSKLIKTLPLDQFKKQKINPYPGMILTYESGHQAKIIAVSAGRVKVDFNHPLAGKKLRYMFKIIEKVDDLKEQFDGLIQTLIGGKINEDLYEIDKRNRIIYLDKSIESLKNFVSEIAQKYLKNAKIEIKNLKENRSKKEIEKSKP